MAEDNGFLNSLVSGLRGAAGAMSQDIFNSQQKQDELDVARKDKMKSGQVAIIQDQIDNLQKGLSMSADVPGDQQKIAALQSQLNALSGISSPTPASALAPQTPSALTPSIQPQTPNAMVANAPTGAGVAPQQPVDPTEPDMSKWGEGRKKQYIEEQSAKALENQRLEKLKEEQKAASDAENGSKEIAAVEAKRGTVNPKTGKEYTDEEIRQEGQSVVNKYADPKTKWSMAMTAYKPITAEEKQKNQDTEEKLKLTEENIKSVIADRSLRGEQRAVAQEQLSQLREQRRQDKEEKSNQQKSATGKQAMFNQRVISSGNQVAQDLSNVVELPISSSTGFFGGRKQGTGLLDANYEVLANKMTSQEAQSYNVMATGFQRSLANIESQGLAPSGSLTHQMDTVLYKEGDTNLTKLQKLSQIRQIADAGLETISNQSNLTDKQRNDVDNIRNKLKDSVPFSQHDLLKLSQLGEVDPNVTMKDVLKLQKKSKPTSQSPMSAPAGLPPLPAGGGWSAVIRK